MEFRGRRDFPLAGQFDHAHRGRGCSPAFRTSGILARRLVSLLTSVPPQFMLFIGDGPYTRGVHNSLSHP
jgi:hypothetical protein